MKYKNKIEKLENKLGNHEIKTAYTTHSIYAYD